MPVAAEVGAPPYSPLSTSGQRECAKKTHCTRMHYYLIDTFTSAKASRAKCPPAGRRTSTWSPSLGRLARPSPRPSMDALIRLTRAQNNTVYVVSGLRSTAVDVLNVSSLPRMGLAAEIGMHVSGPPSGPRRHRDCRPAVSPLLRQRGPEVLGWVPRGRVGRAEGRRPGGGRRRRHRCTVLIPWRATVLCATLGPL
jgi:hypothetical protein